MKFSRSEINTLQLTGVGHFGCHFAMLVFPTAAVSLAHETGTPIATVLGWSFWGYFLFGAGALPVGILTDRTRAKWVVRAGVLGIGPAMMLVSLAQPGVSLVLALALVGILASLYHPAGLSLISRTIRLRGSALGINGVVGNLGIASAPLLTAWVANEWGWRNAYLALGALLFFLGLAVSLRKIEEPEAGAVTRDEHQRLPWERLKLFLILMCAMTMAGLTYRAVTVAQPAYFEEQVQWISYGAATSLVYLLGTLGHLFGGRLADRYDLRIVYLLFHAASLPFVIWMSAASGSLLLGVSTLFLFFSLGMQPIENSLVARFTPDRWRSTGYGLKFTVTFSIGALSVWGVERIINQASIAKVFLAVGIPVSLTILFAIVILLASRGRPVINDPRIGSRIGGKPRA